MRRLAAGLVVAVAALAAPSAAPAASKRMDLWKTYQQVFAKTRYISLSHVIAPKIPVWKGFGPSVFGPAVDPGTGNAYTYAKDGFEANRYELATDQLGTQLDPPAHWAPEYPGIDELPPTYAVRPLVVISIVRKVRAQADYALQVSDVKAWERAHRRIPAGSVVMVRSDWSKRWPDPALAQEAKFPGVSLAALKFLHHKRHILFHGHEPLDTDTTPTLEGESWLMHHGYTQAEGVDNLDQVPATGCLLSIGFPRFKGGLGGYASYTAICPPSWKHGRKVSSADAPLPKYAKPLHWDPAVGYRVR